MSTLIILHGWQSSPEKWQKVKEIIEKEGIKVIVPDLPGFKPKNELTRPWNLDDYVSWVEKACPELVEGACPEPVEGFLLGHSFGGQVAAKFAINHSGKLKGLILVDAAAVRRERKPRFSFFKLFSFLPGYNFLRRVFYNRILKSPDYLKTEGFLKETFKSVIKEDLTNLLSEIKIPTLIIWGKKDDKTPLSDGFLIHQKINNSKLEILENAGHQPYLDNPELLAEKIINFVKNV